MRKTRLGVPITFLVLAAAGSIACSGGLGYAAPGGGYGGGGNGNGGGDGGGGAGQAGAVNIGTGIQFVSSHNASTNPAVDTITAGAAMTWTWSGTLPHSVRSTGTPSFTSSGVRTGAGTYSVTFTTPGTYKYDCSVHGAAMTGTIVVLPAAATAKLNDVTGVLK
jgi:plastocyanin